MPDNLVPKNHYISWLLLATASAVLLYFLWMQIQGPHGLTEIKKLQAQIDELQKANELLSLENEKLYNEVQYRKSDQFLEEILRTELGYVKPGEQVFRWTQQSSEVPESIHDDPVYPSATAENQPIDP